jgi:hypothetical protein
MATVPAMSNKQLPSSQSASQRLRLVVRNLVAVALFVVVVVGLYFLLPIGERPASNIVAGAALLLGAVGLLVLAYLAGLRRVAASQIPVIAAISVLAMFLVTFVVLFAYVYLSLETQRPGQIPGLQTRVDSLYFTVTMLTTVGFGDIAPAGQAARLVATVQMLVNLALIGLVVQAAVKVGSEASAARVKALVAPADGGQDGAA